MTFHDAHNHLHDDRFAGRQAELVAASSAAGVARMVVNGSCESDWPQVSALAREFPELVVPSFGYHPWYVGERTPRWRETLAELLDQTPGAVVGEIGLDRWKPGLAYEGQEEVFLAQLRLAADRNLAASLHCLQTWGRLLELLRTTPRPDRGFLLHSYGGPAEMVAPLVKLGAHFSFPGYFMHERKARQRETFKLVPADRLLIETDAPDQLLPDAANANPLADPATSKPLNHPANLPAVYQFVAELRGVPLVELAAQVGENFRRLFEPRRAVDTTAGTLTIRP
jgi:TatD DNase family protein